ncbi:hypothetical protein QE152_g36027 [Popillia japonica]|uniref:Uncharacterized protein n=1 Tax=Popillia japonica TaxID=7064 RepID=A0AAW1IEE3_POPJA
MLENKIVNLAVPWVTYVKDGINTQIWLKLLNYIFQDTHLKIHIQKVQDSMTASAGDISNDIDTSASNDEVDMVSNIIDKNTSDVLWDVLPTNNVVTQSNKISKIKCCTDTTFKGRETTSCKVTLDPPVEVNNSNLYLIVPRNNLLINKSLDIMDNFTEIQNKTVKRHNFSYIPQKLFENTVIGYLKICESNEGLDEEVDCFVTTIGERNVSINESLEYQQKEENTERPTTISVRR